MDTDNTGKHYRRNRLDQKEEEKGKMSIVFREDGQDLLVVCVDIDISLSLKKLGHKRRLLKNKQSYLKVAEM